MNSALPAPRIRTVGNARLTAIRYAPFTERKRSTCPDSQLWFMLGGGWTTWMPGSPRRETNALALSFHPPGEQNRQLVSAEGAVAFSMQIPNALLRDSAAFLQVPSESLQREGGLANVRAGRVLSAFFSEDQAAELLIEEELPRLLQSLMPSASALQLATERRWVQIVINLLNDRFADKLTLNEIAALAGVHPVHLATAFRQRMGCTIGEYLRQIRLEAAFRQICATDLDLAQIAAGVGFYDQAHFSRLFKVHFNATPSELRREIRFFSLHP